MKFGMTSSKSELIEQLTYVTHMMGFDRFAWLPRKMVDGSWVWLETYFETTRNGIIRKSDGQINIYQPYTTCSYQNRLCVKYLVSFNNGPRTSILRDDDAYNFLIEYKAELLAKLNSL